MKICLDCEHLKTYWKTVPGAPEFFSKYLCFKCTKLGIETDAKSKGSCHHFKKLHVCPRCGCRLKDEDLRHWCPVCYHPAIRQTIVKEEEKTC